MIPNAKQLAMRDPARAALTGALSGSDFGSEADGVLDVGGDYQFGVDPNMSPFAPGAEFGAPEGWEFGSYYGYGQDAAPAPHPAAVQQIVQQHMAAQALAKKRGSLLEPNRGSSIKVERYSFALNQTITLAAAVALSMSAQPTVTIRPQRVFCNAPAANFASLASMNVANVNVFVGGSTDAIEFANVSVGSILDLPTLSPANKATVTGAYTGFVPPGYAGATAFLFVVSFQGPAQIVA